MTSESETPGAGEQTGRELTGRHYHARRCSQTPTCIISMVSHANATDTRDVSAEEMVNAIRAGKWREAIQQIRATFSRSLNKPGGLKNAKEAVAAAKKNLPAFTPSGKFSSRKKPVPEKLLKHSGLLCADLDQLGERLAEVRTKVLTSRHLWALFLSPSGHGLKAIFKVPADPEQHNASFRAVQQHVRELCGTEIDTSRRDLGGLCFVSFDPDCYLNTNAVALESRAELEKPKRIATAGAWVVDPGMRQRIAVELLGKVEWDSDRHGFCVCPGKHLHTTGDGERDCEIHLDGAPTVHCFHNHCREVLESINHELRSRIGKVECANTKPPGEGKDEQPSYPSRNPEEARELQKDISALDSGGSSADDQTLSRLAALPALEYERIREAEAERLSCRVSVLDSLVEAKRPPKPRNDILQGQAVRLLNVEPWPEAVNGTDVLDAIAEKHTRYIVLPPGAADVLALWDAHTHCYKIFQHSPRLDISSPLPRSGKTLLCDVTACFVPRPLLTENLSTAVLFRVVDGQSPTILADEYDTWLPKNDELRGLFNAGHRRGAMVYRCEGENNEVRGFAAFAPAVLCGIGTLPGTLHDRSIVLRLKRAKRGEVKARFDSRHVEIETILCRKLARWCADHQAELEACDPQLPETAFNRIADNWRPLFAIAEVAGGDWPKRISEAFTKLTSADDLDAQGIGTLLLTDIAQIFSTSNTDRLPSATLTESLVAIEGRPWAEWGKTRKPISTNQLANQLRDFEISPHKIRFGETPLQGYDLADFRDAFERYSLNTPNTSLSEWNTGTTLGKTPVFETEHPGSVFHPEKAPVQRECSGVPLQREGKPDIEAVSTENEPATPPDASENSDSGRRDETLRL